jgi:hypothetical protein
VLIPVRNSSDGDLGRIGHPDPTSAAGFGPGGVKTRPMISAAARSRSSNAW